MNFVYHIDRSQGIKKIILNQKGTSNLQKCFVTNKSSYKQ